MRTLTDTFVIPDGFSLEEYMKSAWSVERGDEIQVVIRFSSRAARLVREVEWHPSQTVSESPDDSAVMITTTGSRAAAIPFKRDPRAGNPDHLSNPATIV